MSDELKPVRCGCGGKAIVKKHTFYRALPLYSVRCDKCGIQVPSRNTEAEAVTAWNRAMGYEPDTFTKDGSIRNPIMWEGMKYGYCVKCDCYCREDEHICPRCGARLEWYE